MAPIAFFNISPEEIVLNGGGGGSGTGDDGGGVPGTSTGSSTGLSLPVGENGGVLATAWYLFVPVQDCNTRLCYIGIYCTDCYNDPRDPSYYKYRAEDVVKHSVVTVNRVILVYRDIGKATITVKLTGTNDDGKVVTASKQVKIGTEEATGALVTKYVDIQLTCFMPQLSFEREAAAGPVCITSVTMRGEVSEDL